MASTTSTTESRALILLGQGVPPTAVAHALGVDPSRITQLLGDQNFAQQVVELKFQALSKHNERDTNIDSLEDRLLEKLKDCLPFMTRPMEILKSFSILNAAKRRGQTSQESLTSRQTIIQLNIPQIVLEKFTANVHNQVIQVGSQSLLTIPSGQLLKVSEEHTANEQLKLTQREETVSRIVQEPRTPETTRNEQGSSSKDPRVPQALLSALAGIKHNSPNIQRV